MTDCQNIETRLLHQALEGPSSRLKEDHFLDQTKQTWPTFSVSLTKARHETSWTGVCVGVCVCERVCECVSFMVRMKERPRLSIWAGKEKKEERKEGEMEKMCMRLELTGKF